MTITLDLEPAVEARLIEQVAARGTSVEEFIKFVIERNLGAELKEFPNSLCTAAEWESALDEFANSPGFATSANQLVDDSRENIHREREDAQR